MLILAKFKGDKVIKSISLFVLLVASINAEQIAKIPPIKYDDVSTIKPENFPTNKDKFSVIEGKANYQLFVGVVGKVTSNEKEVFFGKTADFRPFEEKGKSIPLSASAGAADALTGKGDLILNAGKEGLKNGIAGLGFGIFYAALDPYVKEYQKQASLDTQYSYVVEFIDQNAKTVGKLSILFVADDDDYSEEEILQIIKNKKKDSV